MHFKEIQLNIYLWVAGKSRCMCRLRETSLQGKKDYRILIYFSSLFVVLVRFRHGLSSIMTLHRLITLHLFRVKILCRHRRRRLAHFILAILIIFVCCLPYNTLLIANGGHLFLLFFCRSLKWTQVWKGATKIN